MNVILDIDGTLIEGERAINHSQSLLKTLKETGHQYLLATNSIKNKFLQKTRLEKAGLLVDEEQIFNPIESINQYLSAHQAHKIYVVGSEREIQQIHGVQSEKDPELIILLDFERINIDYHQLQNLVDLIENGCPVFSASRSPYYLKNGKKHLDTGAFTTLLEAVIDREIPVFGKPSVSYYHQARQKFRQPSLDTWVVGDDWKNDILAGKDAGMKTILVTSGKYRLGDEKKCMPDLVLGDFLSFWL